MEDIISLYKSGWSGPKIAKTTGLKTYQIYYILEKHGISCRTNKENYKIILANDFSKIGNELESYLLGILLTDGQIQIRRQSSMILRLDLVKQDRIVLDLLEEYLGLKDRVKIYNRKPPNQDVARIVIPSDKLCNNLAKYGIIPKKTFATKFPNIEQRLYRHFIRGCSDGDGCFTGHHWKLTGTKSLLKKIQHILVTELGFSRTLLHKRHKERSNNIRSLEYGGARQIAKLYNYLYSNANYFLPRKKNKAYEIAKKYL